jgi:hypothetical protein
MAARKKDLKPQNSPCICRTHKCDARIVSLAGLEIAIGFLILESAGDPGLFLPVQEGAALQTLDKTSYAKVRAEVGSHHHFLLGWCYTGNRHRDEILLHRRTNWRGGYFQFERDE